MESSVVGEGNEPFVEEHVAGVQAELTSRRHRGVAHSARSVDDDGGKNDPILAGHHNSPNRDVGQASWAPHGSGAFLEERPRAPGGGRSPACAPWSVWPPPRSPRPWARIALGRSAERARVLCSICFRGRGSITCLVWPPRLRSLEAPLDIAREGF